jgi:hypothetical protein
MPTEFLTDEQEQAYGHYLGPPSTPQLSRYFHLDDADRERVNERRGAGNKLGFAVQLTTVRFLGTFLAEPTDVPSDVVAYVAAQLDIRDVACLADYAARPATAWEHAAEIRRVYSYRDFTDPAEGFRLVRWLYTHAWLSSEQPSVLFDLATARLVEQQVLLPGVSILARLVARIRERANARLYRKLARMPSAEQRDRLKELLVVPAGARRSALDRLRRGPTQPTAAGLLEALRRLSDARVLGVSDLDPSGIPAGRVRVLARYASSARAQVFQRMPAEHGIATLLAFVCALQNPALSTNAGFSSPKNRSGSTAGSSATVASQASLTGVLRRSRVARVRARFFRMLTIQVFKLERNWKRLRHVQPGLLRDVLGRGLVRHVA